MLICRSCQSKDLVSVIQLGDSPLANGLLKEESLSKEEPVFNLEVMLCTGCGLAQLKDIVPPESLFSEYLYFSSNSPTMVNSAKRLVNTLATGLDQQSQVVEIASNDGYLLQHYLSHNINVLGVEPAKNIAKIANDKGIKTVSEFFSKSFANQLVKDGVKADIIHANNVMAHVPNIVDFVQGLKILLKNNGQIVVEVPYLKDLVQKLEFDTIYHEHVYYFSLKPLVELFERNGLQIFDVEKLNIHGGSLRLFICHKGEVDVSDAVTSILSEEDEIGICSVDYFRDFMQKLSDLKSDLKKVLKDLKGQGKKIAAYGASAKGTTLLNFFNIGGDVLDFVADKSRVKQGYYTPGTKLCIKPPASLQADNVDYALLLTWNFAEEIMKEQDSFIKNGGKFIMPLPAVKVVA